MGFTFDQIPGKSIQAKVVSLATMVRKTMLCNKKDSRYCESLSKLLIKQMKDVPEFGKPKLVHGFFDNMAHAWIELNGKILDVTADQFGNYPKVWYPASKKHYKKVRVERGAT